MDSCISWDVRGDECMALLGRGEVDVVAGLCDNLPHPDTDTLQGGLHRGEIVVGFLPSALLG